MDKRKALDPDRFGYLSLHYVASLDTRRAELAEYKRFANNGFEIQIRSILQHAWAEIEHDLGYKSRLGVPSTTRRRFSRLAGLLELADAEFVSIRDELRLYEKRVESDLANQPGRPSLPSAAARTCCRSLLLVQVARGNDRATEPVQAGRLALETISACAPGGPASERPTSEPTKVDGWSGLESRSPHGPQTGYFGGKYASSWKANS
ncbi:GTP pyrophosphokinase [Nonomuraea basaltis]|uniref:GTP pyrophosphokinase n=1 Tax=Nonomuraea basaltis TaxID=2495887 RepID=UPI00110C5702|nr:hypothetical protein EJK15_34215 [Nonomuraea basaltis]